MQTDILKTYTVTSRDGSYIGKAKATNSAEACYVLYHEVWRIYPGHGELVDIHPQNAQTYVLFGIDEGPGYFDNYRFTVE